MVNWGEVVHFWSTEIWLWHVLTTVILLRLKWLLKLWRFFLPDRRILVLLVGFKRSTFLESTSRGLGIIITTILLYWFWIRSMICNRCMAVSVLILTRLTLMRRRRRRFTDIKNLQKILICTELWEILQWITLSFIMKCYRSQGWMEGLLLRIEMEIMWLWASILSIILKIIKEEALYWPEYCFNIYTNGLLRWKENWIWLKKDWDCKG